jgi:hypothetical protein
MPTIDAVSPGCSPAILIALNVVTPAQESGAASNDDTSSGTLTT